jgi:hydrogenase maturation protease
VTEESSSGESSGPPASPPGRVVICVGSLFRGDDAMGLRAAAELRKRLSPDILVLERDGEPTALLEAWDGADTVVVVDAVRSGNVPGTVVRCEFGRQPLARSARPASSHALGVAETVALGSALGRLPRRLIVWGVEAQSFDAGAPPTDRVIAAIPKLVRGVLQEFGDLPVEEETRDE